MKRYFLLASAGLLLTASCNFRSVKGDGHMTSKTYDLNGFTDVEASAVMKVYLKQGADYSIKIDGEENILALMKVHVEGGKLDIDFKDNVSINPTRDVAVYITAPEFHNLDGSGSCDFISQGVLKTNNLKVGLSGACNTDLEVETQKVTVEGSGSSAIELKGKTAELAIDGSGSTKARCFGLLADRVKVTISGSGNAEVNVASALSVDISGSGDVAYKGSPATIDKDISGSGSVHKVD